MSFYCKENLCINRVDRGNFYCEKHGGRERAVTEGLIKARPQRKQCKHKVFFERRGAPVGQGLSQGKAPRTAEELAVKRERDAAKKARHEERRKKLLENQPEGRKGQGGKESVWGTGNSKDAKRRVAKKRKRDARSGKRRKNKQNKQSKN